MLPHHRYIIFLLVRQNDYSKPKYRDMNIIPVVPSSDEEDFLYEEYDFFCE